MTNCYSITLGRVPVELSRCACAKILLPAAPAALPIRARPAIVSGAWCRGCGRDMGSKASMSEQRTRVVAIGEVMIEMARGSDGRFGMACGGDTFNTAVYLARAGIDVSYATALGDDPY